MEKKCGIYIITNKITNKSYIGQSTHLFKRIRGHRTNKTNITSDIAKAIHLYGSENFFFDILIECPIEQLDNMEIFFIDKFNTHWPFGYNIATGGKKAFSNNRKKVEIFLKNSNPENFNSRMFIAFDTKTKLKKSIRDDFFDLYGYEITSLKKKRKKSYRKKLFDIIKESEILELLEKDKKSIQDINNLQETNSEISSILHIATRRTK